jgi:hypothetical protein
MHHTHLVLDANYILADAVDVAITEMQTFMYAVFQEQLKNNKGRLLVSQFEATCDAPSFCQEFVKFALRSAAAHFSVDKLLQYITTTLYPGTWRGTSHAFGLHWKE